MAESSSSRAAHTIDSRPFQLSEFTAAAKQCSSEFWLRLRSFHWQVPSPVAMSKHLPYTATAVREDRNAKLQFDQEKSKAWSRCLAAPLVGQNHFGEAYLSKESNWNTKESNWNSGRVSRC